jgi:CheY-like chemotaxis protein
MTAPVSNATAIDLLLLTMRLPDTDYLGTIHAIEKHLPPHHPLKTILITNNFGPQFSKEIEHQITISILDRPFTPVDLFDAVATLFDISKIGQIDQKLIIEDAKRQFIGTHILVAEDNEFNQMLISELLSNWGITVSLASNGIECLDLLRQTEPSFNLIFMDIQMPEMDGLEATRRIRQDLHLSIPIIALTANIMIEDQQKYLRAGMDAYLPKPFDPDQLYQILHRFM